MTSITSATKQSQGYFLVLSGTNMKGYTYAGGSGAGGSFVPGAMTDATLTFTAGEVLRDMGKTVLVGGIGASAGSSTAAGTAGVPTRVFRKIQRLNTITLTGDANNVANGVGGTVTNNYQSYYIELPTLGRSGLGNSNALGASVVYINGLPGLYV
jgi:hypothetical protein